MRKNLRTAHEYERIFDRYVRPRIGRKSIYNLNCRDVVEMLDAIEDEHGPVMAHRTLARLRKAFNWHGTRDDAFVPPIVRGDVTNEYRRRGLVNGYFPMTNSGPYGELHMHWRRHIRECCSSFC